MKTPSLPHPLIDILSPDSFAEEHLPGAINFCVYETSFLEKVRIAYPDSALPLTVYGLDDSTLEAKVAAEKLRTAGYENVSVLPGGLTGWKSGGGAIEQREKTAAEISTVRYEIDSDSSFVHWIGQNLFNYHTGNIKISGGAIALEGSHLQDGKFTIDMTSLQCSDLQDSALNAMLIAHLKSDDFFSVESYPQAEFVLTSAEYLAPGTSGIPNYSIGGNLTLRGVTQPIQFSALIAERPDGGFTTQAFLEIDRTLWRAIYGSGKFFARLGQHVVNDFVHLHLKVATRSQPFV